MLSDKNDGPTAELSKAWPPAKYPIGLRVLFVVFWGAVVATALGTFVIDSPSLRIAGFLIAFPISVVGLALSVWRARQTGDWLGPKAISPGNQSSSHSQTSADEDIVDLSTHSIRRETMPGWEYKHYQPSSLESWGGTIAELNAMGAAGWEVVAVWGTSSSGSTVFILKRPLQARS